MRIDRPTRVKRSYVQHLVGDVDRVLPLLCPVREADWIEGWDPVAVWTDTGVAEPDCVFVTPSDDGEAVWYVTRHSLELGEVEMIKVTPGVTACRLTIRLTPSATGTDAEVTYLHTSLGPAGDAFVEAFTAEHYELFMRDWEARLNHYLTTGTMLRAEPGEPG